MHIHAQVFIFVFMCACTGMHVRLWYSEINTGSFSKKMSFSVDSSPCIWKQSLSLNPELDRPARNPEGPFICLPSVGIIYSCLPGFLCGRGGSDLRPSCL